MKHYIVNILVAAALTLCSLTSCVKENISAPDHGEGTVYLSLNVLSGGMDQVIVKSPWDPNDDNERAVENLRIYIFSKATGNLVGYKYFSKDDLTFTDDSSQPGYDRTATVSNIPTSTGEVYIYAIANARTSQYKVTDDAILDIDESNLSHLTRETFLSATCTRQLGSINPADNRFVMSGFANDGKHVTIARKGTTQQAEITSPTDEDAKRVKLYKILSKNKITVKSGNGVTFKPEYMEIHNVPQVYGLMRGNNVAPSGFETFDRIIWSENSYQFYLPANVQTATASPASFNDREKNTYDAGKKTFVNAPENATYVVIHGKYQGGDYAGDLSYTVHLGDFSKNMADFSVAANSNYEYTLTIKGVNNFIAESRKEDGADDPGSEGVVIFKGTDILEVDCHYEARAMKFSMSELNQIINVDHYGYILKIQTAFCETISMIVDGEGRIYDAAEFKTQSNPTVLTTVGSDGMPVDASRILISGDADFDWVRFVKNTGVYSATPKSSPGCMVSSSHDISDVCAYPGRANTQTIFEFLRDLYKAGKEQNASYFNATGSSVYVTCFVDENYYADKNWTEYVNKSEPRRMYFANELFVSADGQSSFAKAKYVVSQKSIWTFYELDPTLKPFGLEFVSEEKAQGKNVANGTNSRQEYWNGRASAIRNNSGNKFYDNSTKSANGTQDLYLSAYRACMSRNRDESGDGKIDADEIKWYLASVDQYKGMWAGEEALNTDMRLFKATESEWAALKKAFGNGDDSKLSPWHYFTCSPANTFWAEEGCATGVDGSATMVRCIRTLESKANGLGEADKYYEYDPATETVTMLLNSDALRSAQSGGFQTYFERGKDSNKLYKKFKIASANLSGTYYRNQVISTAKGSGFINASDDVCQKSAEYGGSWRVPNQRELSIMSAVNNETFRSLFSCTSFTGVQSGYYKGGTGNEYGFVLAGTQMTVAVGADASYGVRCVMDVVD